MRLKCEATPRSSESALCRAYSEIQLFLPCGRSVTRWPVGALPFRPWSSERREPDPRPLRDPERRRAYDFGSDANWELTCRRQYWPPAKFKPFHRANRPSPNNGEGNWWDPAE